MLDLRGFVAETNATHVFIVRDGHVATPNIVACPEGITRATVLEICAANAISLREADLTLDDVYAADEMFCTGTMGELAGVIKLDGRTIGNGEIGPMTRRLSALFAERTAVEGTAVA
jgi:branched-chain amino acid aminotransferase